MRTTCSDPPSGKPGGVTADTARLDKLCSVRRFEFPVDLSHAKAVNETLADVRRLRMSAIIVGLLLAGGAVWLILLAHPWSYILGAVLAIAAVTSLWVAVWAPRKVGNAQQLYEKSGLVPAIVAETRPRGSTILALIDIAKPTSDTAQYALVVRNVGTLPGHRVRVGERVPCVSVLTDRSTRSESVTWEMVSPMPIAWGTRDVTVLRDAVAAISDVEWQLLADKLSLVEEVSTSPTRHLLLDPAELPDELR